MTFLSSKYDWHFSILDFWLSKYDAMIRSLFWKILVTRLWSTCNLSRDSIASRTLSLASFNRSHHSSSSGLSRSFASKTFLISKCYYFIWVINPKLDQNIVELVKNWFKIIPRTICCALFISLMVWWYWFRFSIWNLKVSLKRELANCFSYSDVGDNVMLVTLWWWPFQDIGGRIIILVTLFMRWIRHQHLISVTNIPRSPTSLSCHQYIPSPTFVANIDLAIWFT